MVTILISIILISVILNIFQFIQIDRIIKERNTYFNIIINSKFNNEEPERKPIGFQQFAELGNREDEPEDKLHNSRLTLPFRKIRFPRNKGPV